MRLALQRLLADSDALRYLRNTLRASRDSVKVPTPTVCQNCRRQVRVGKARNYYTLNSRLQTYPVSTVRSPIRRLDGSPFHHETEGKDDRSKRDSCHQKYLKRNPRILNECLVGHESTSRERILWRLLDEPTTHNAFPVWLELAHTRRRVHGVEGTRLVWRAILERGLSLPTVGDTADRLWTGFLELGFNDPSVLKDIFIYAREQDEACGRAWRRLYATVIGHYLQENRDKAWLCHMRLHKHFPPSNQQLRKLFMLALPDEKLRQLYLAMHKYFPQARIYDIAIPELCKQGLYATAVTWHKKLIERKDLPSSVRTTELVMHYLAMTGAKTQLMECTRLMVAAGVTFTPYKAQNILIPTAISRKLMNVSEDENDDGSENGYSDEFCARLVATRFFSIENIINTLGFLGVREIGPLALRELATRELPHNPYCRAVQDRLDQLSKASVSTGRSTFSILVRRLAAEGQSHLLANVVACDLHTDTFEDYNLQESLLTFYHENSDTIAFNRTMAILTAKVPERDVLTRRWNLLLRSYLTRRELQAVKNTVGKMQELQLPIEPRSATHMGQTLLSRRQTGRRPADTEELGLLVHIWQDVLRSGSQVPPYVWTEILRRLGMSGRLVALERLALWLAAWYSSPANRTSMSCILSRSAGDTELLHPTTNIDLKPNNPLHPLHVIFAPALQQAIVAWGFQHSHSARQGRGRHLSRLDWTWGLSLLRKLRDRNVHVGQQNVSKAFRLRILILFGPSDSKRKINRLIRQRNKDSLGLYIKKAKEVWGLDLLGRPQPKICHEERQMIPPSFMDFK